MARAARKQAEIVQLPVPVKPTRNTSRKDSAVAPNDSRAKPGLKSSRVVRPTKQDALTPEAPRKRWYSRIRMPKMSLRIQILLFIYFSIATVAVMIIARPWILDLGAWGYAGAFGISLLGNASVLLPAPGAAVIIMMAKDFDPLLLGVASGIGGTFGASTSYLAGMLSGKAIENNRFYRMSRRAMGRVGGLIIFLFTLAPFLPMDAASIVAGAIRYPFLRYLLVMGLAHTIKMVAITWLVANAGTDFLNWLPGVG